MTDRTKCDGPRLAAGDRPQGANCLESLARGECGWDDMCGHCLRLGMVALDWVTGSDLPWHPSYQVAAEIDESPTPRPRLRNRFALRIVGGAA